MPSGYPAIEMAGTCPLPFHPHIRTGSAQAPGMPATQCQALPSVVLHASRKRTCGRVPAASGDLQLLRPPGVISYLLKHRAKGKWTLPRGTTLGGTAVSQEKAEGRGLRQ